jgi:phenylacetate-coenzyme A ligase PaaK-like adenylate-forming protein
MMQFPLSDAISRVHDPLNWTVEKTQLFVDACREMALFHSSNSKEIAFLYKRHSFDPDSIRTEADIARIPLLGVTAMKYNLITSLPHESATLKLTSSGTRGQKTQIWFDEGSLARVQAMMDVCWGQMGLVSKTPTNYCNFIYDPEEAKDLGIAFSVKNEERFATPKRAYFTVKKNSAGNWEFRADETIAILKEYIREGNPVRILGIPSFVFELLLKLEESGPLQLPPGSWMLIGGGWKAAEDKKVTRDQFRQMVTERLGIPDDRIRDLFGMAEHSAPYGDCPKHRFHIPVFNRILSRDPVTMEVLPPGKMGLLEFVTPFNAMMPTLSILSTDLGFINEDPCSCGWSSPTFTLVGRGGLVKHKGCAITATEIVKRGA